MTKITKIVLDHSFSLIVCDLLQLDLGIKNFDNKIKAVKLFKIIFIFRYFSKTFRYISRQQFVILDIVFLTLMNSTY